LRDLFEDSHYYSVEEALSVSLVSDYQERHPKDLLLDEMPRLEFEVGLSLRKKGLRREVEEVCVVSPRRWEVVPKNSRGEKEEEAVHPRRDSNASMDESSVQRGKSNEAEDERE